MNKTNSGSAHGSLVLQIHAQAHSPGQPKASQNPAFFARKKQRDSGVAYPSDRQSGLLLQSRAVSWQICEDGLFLSIKKGVYDLSCRSQHVGTLIPLTHLKPVCSHPQSRPRVFTQRSCQSHQYKMTYGFMT